MSDVYLLTDFGRRDGSICQMIGVIRSINCDSYVGEMTNDVPLGDIQTGAFLLEVNIHEYYPDGSVFLAVVDPGVGTDRRPIIVGIKNGKNRYILVGPDNGILSLAFGEENFLWARRIDNSNFWLPKVSSTFHGRDIFAPVAGYLSRGINPTDLAREEITYKDLNKVFLPMKEKDGLVEGEVIFIDDFGNLVVSITGDVFNRIVSNRTFKVKVESHAIDRIVSTFSDISEDGEVAALFGGDFVGRTSERIYMTLAANGGSAAEITGAEIGTPVRITYQ